MFIRSYKRILPVFLLIMTAGLAGCGKNYDEAQVVRVWTQDGEMTGGEDETGPGAQTAVDARIGMVIDEGQAEDDSFVMSACSGLESIAETTKADTVISESPSIDGYAQCFEELAAQDCDLCWGIGFNCKDAMAESARLHPETSFAIIDSDYEDAPSNVTGVTFRAQEPSFLVGYIAGAVTSSGRLGFVGGVRSETLDQFQYGFEAGARYAAYVYSKNVEVTSEYADSFADPEKGKEIARKMYADGCDIVYHAAGGTGIGVIEAAVEADRFVIGVDQDQSYLAPDNVLTSALKKVDVALERVTDVFLSGQDIGGSNISFGLTEGAVGIPTEHDNYRDEIYDAALVIEDRIKSGDIVVPTDAGELETFINELEENGS